MTTTVFTTRTPGLPCSWDVDTTCCESWDTLTPTLQSAAAEYGALTLWAATGRRFGLCTRTVRPCGRDCPSCGGIGYYWSEGSWRPYIFDGQWRNCWCGDSPACCTCAPACQVWLPGPVANIPVTGVSQDGAIVASDAWRVDDGQWLVRTDGNCWPLCQNYSVDSGTNTFFVTYQVGIPVPSVLARAAGELACEWVKSCQGAPCRLPQRIQSIARQGVTISMVGIDDMLKAGFTGIATVDQVIASFNPYGLKSRMRVSSPDLPTTRQVTQA